MTKKILFRLDVLGIHFGIAKYIQEEYDFNISAIVEINKGKKFYEHQKIVPFEKIWFFRNYIKNTFKTPDLQYLRNFEEKYNISLWQLAYGDQLFFHYNEYWKFSSNEILLIFEHACRFYENILDEFKPDYLFTRLTDNSVDHLLALMCQAKNIPVLTLSFSRLGTRYMLLNQYDKFDQDIVNSNNAKHRTLKELRDYVLKYSKQQEKLRKVFRTSKSSLIKASLNYFKLVLSPNYSKFYTYFGRNLFTVLFFELGFLLKRKIRNSFINKNLKRKINYSIPYLYFPLHAEPERTLLIDAPFYTNQLVLIINIAKSLPISYQLYVKEHPFQKIKGWRSSLFYKEIMNLPNVTLIHPSVSNDDLIKNSKLVLTITGTSSLEASLNDVPSIVFTNTIFSELSSVHRVSDITELPNIISKSLFSKVNVSELNDFILKIETNSFDFPEKIDLEAELNKRFHYGGFLYDVDYDELAVDEFFKKHESIFKKLCLEHIKKIEQIESY